MITHFWLEQRAKIFLWSEDLGNMSAINPEHKQHYYKLLSISLMLCSQTKIKKDNSVVSLTPRSWSRPKQESMFFQNNYILWSKSRFRQNQTLLWLVQGVVEAYVATTDGITTDTIGLPVNSALTTFIFLQRGQLHPQQANKYFSPSAGGASLAA